VVSWTPASGQEGDHAVEIQAENAYGTDTQSAMITVAPGSNEPDADHDGITDGADNCPLVPNPDQTNTDVVLNNNPDAEGDACDADDDGDGLPDAYEDGNGLDSLDPADAFEDTDGDGLTRLQEYQYGTDDNKPDSDGDGYSDGDEVASNSDPSDAGDLPTRLNIQLIKAAVEASQTAPE